MKKTTYIIMVLIAICLAGSFFLPAAIFTSKIPQAVKICKTGEVVEITPGRFYEVKVETGNSLYISGEDPSIPLTLRISSADSITQPKIYMDKSWEHNVSYLIEDDVLTISVCLDSLIKDGINPSGDNIIAPADNSLVAELVVPTGWFLHHIEPHHLYLDMKGIKEDSLKIAYAVSGVTMTDCEIPDLVIVN